MRLTKTSILMAALVAGASMAGNAQAAGNADATVACAGLPTHAQLQAALSYARNLSNGGFNLDMWGTVVNRDGIVCAVAFTGTNRGSQWPGSRVISAQKANTANPTVPAHQLLGTGGTAGLGLTAGTLVGQSRQLLAYLQRSVC